MAKTELSSATRSRILETAWAQVRDRGIKGLSVKDVAETAGVSRQLVYFHYGSRAGLLRAMARNRDRQSRIGPRLLKHQEQPPVEALEGMIRTWCEYIPELLPVARALEASLITGDEGATAWEDRFGDLYGVFHDAVERVAEAGRLAPDWTTDTATDFLWALLQPSSWDYLVEMRGWAAEEWIDRLTQVAVNTLVAS